VAAAPGVIAILTAQRVRRGSVGEPRRRSSRQADTVPSVVLAADIQMIIGSGMPVVLAIGFAGILALRRRDRRRSDPGDD